MLKRALGSSGLVATLLLVASGCVTTPTLAPKTDADLVSEARSRITEVEPAAVAAEGDGAIIIDVREPDEYQDGHIPGAVSVPRGVLEFRLAGIDALEDLDDEERLAKPLLLYCRSGKRAALATATLMDMGYANARSIAGGFKAWEAAGLPTEKPAD